MLSWRVQNPSVWWCSYHHPHIKEMPHCHETTCEEGTWKNGLYLHNCKVWKPNRLGFITCLCWKANDNFWVCLKNLNVAIQWDHHRAQMVEDVTHNFAGLHYLTRVTSTLTTGKLFLTLSHLCAWPSTAPLDTTDSYDHPLFWLVAKMCLSEEWTESLKILREPCQLLMT